MTGESTTGVTMTGVVEPPWDLFPGPTSGSGPRGGARARWPRQRPTVMVGRRRRQSRWVVVDDSHGQLVGQLEAITHAVPVLLLKYYKNMLLKYYKKLEKVTGKQAL